jgi:hypothetical protein
MVQAFRLLSATIPLIALVSASAESADNLNIDVAINLV